MHNIFLGSLWKLSCNRSYIPIFIFILLVAEYLNTGFKKKKKKGNLSFSIHKSFSVDPTWLVKSYSCLSLYIHVDGVCV